MEDYQKQQVYDKFASYTEVKDADVSTVLVNSDAIENKVSGPLERFCNDIKSMLALVNAYSSGEYKGIPFRTIVAIIGTLLYVFFPVDVIPDFIPFLGLVDDAMMMGLCVAAVEGDLHDFRQWEYQCKVERETERSRVRRNYYYSNRKPHYKSYKKNNRRRNNTVYTARRRECRKYTAWR